MTPAHGQDTVKRRPNSAVAFLLLGAAAINAARIDAVRDLAWVAYLIALVLFGVAFTLASKQAFAPSRGLGSRHHR